MTFYNFLLLNKYDDMAFFFRKKAPLSVLKVFYSPAISFC